MECVLCEEQITNPICPACLQEEMQQWLIEERKEQMLSELNELTRSIFYNAGDVDCIKCHSLMGVCAYCYTQEVFALIRKNPTLVEKYLTYFNYDHDHAGWEKEAAMYREE